MMRKWKLREVQQLAQGHAASVHNEPQDSRAGRSRQVTRTSLRPSASSVSAGLFPVGAQSLVMALTMYEIPGAAQNNRNSTSQFWSPQVLEGGAGRARSPASAPPRSSGALQAVLGAPSITDASPPLCLRPHRPIPVDMTVSGHQVRSHPRDLPLAYYTCNDPVSKKVTF